MLCDWAALGRLTGSLSSASLAPYCGCTGRFSIFLSQGFRVWTRSENATAGIPWPTYLALPSTSKPPFHHFWYVLWPPCLHGCPPSFVLSKDSILCWAPLRTSSRLGQQRKGAMLTPSGVNSRGPRTLGKPGSGPDSATSSLFDSWLKFLYLSKEGAWLDRCVSACVLWNMSHVIRSPKENSVVRCT